MAQSAHYRLHAYTHHDHPLPCLQHRACSHDAMLLVNPIKRPHPHISMIITHGTQAWHTHNLFSHVHTPRSHPFIWINRASSHGIIAYSHTRTHHHHTLPYGSYRASSHGTIIAYSHTRTHHNHTLPFLYHRASSHDTHTTHSHTRTHHNHTLPYGEHRASSHGTIRTYRCSQPRSKVSMAFCSPPNRQQNTRETSNTLPAYRQAICKYIHIYVYTYILITTYMWVPLDWSAVRIRILSSLRAVLFCCMKRSLFAIYIRLVCQVNRALLHITCLELLANFERYVCNGVLWVFTTM